MHQMSFAQADAGIQKQRIKRHVSRFGDFPGSRIGKFVGFADDKIVERILRIQRHRQGLVGIGLKFVAVGQNRIKAGLVDVLRSRAG